MAVVVKVRKSSHSRLFGFMPLILSSIIGCGAPAPTSSEQLTSPSNGSQPGGPNPPASPKGVKRVDEPALPTKEFRSKNVPFSVQLPTACIHPATKEEPVIGETNTAGLVSSMLMGQVPNKTMFLVMAFGFPKEKKKDDKRSDDEKLSQAGSEMAKNMKGKLLLETKISQKQYPGREWQIEGEGGISRIRMYLVKDGVYQVMATGDSSNSVVGDAFFDSFKILMDE